MMVSIFLTVVCVGDATTLSGAAPVFLLSGVGVRDEGMSYSLWAAVEE